MIDKNPAKVTYRASRRPMGIFAVRNLINGRVYVGSSTDLSAEFSRIRFQLYAGAHPVKDLEADWKRYGTGNFEFEILEELPPQADPSYNPAADLERLEHLWLEKLQPYGDKGYNEKN